MAGSSYAFSVYYSIVFAQLLSSVLVIKIVHMILSQMGFRV